MDEVVNWTGSKIKNIEPYFGHSCSLIYVSWTSAGLLDLHASTEQRILSWFLEGAIQHLKKLRHLTSSSVFANGIEGRRK